MRDTFQEHLLATNLSGSGKAFSYLRALDLLSQMISVEPLGFEDCQDIWAVTSIGRLQQLYECANEQKHLGRSSIWIIKGIPRSYLNNGYCTAALRAYQEFLVQHSYERNVLERYSSFNGDAAALPQRLQRSLTIPNHLLENWGGQEGRETTRTIKARFNQNVFRKYTLANYQERCCITGNPIPRLLTASHIKPWSVSDTAEKLDPRNGLCLAKTQDAAFDQGLLTLDEKLKVVLSKRIRDHMTIKSIQDNFLQYEGNPITLPQRYQPAQGFLDYHREKVFAS